jgi:alpha-galactosidase
MMTSNRIKTAFTLAALAIAGFAFNAAAHAAKPLKVYILSGQSNMEGQAKVETFDYIGDDPATAPMLKEMRGPDGKPRVCEKVWISYLTGSPDKGTMGEGTGKLTAGYGSRSNPAEDGGKIGPEFTFGIYASKAYDGPILIIKTAWGGKSLNTDFRPPSAGPYEFNDAQLEGLKKQGKDIAQAKADKAKATGRYYKLMIEHVKKVLADPKRIVPNYDPAQGYEIAGFAWLQGWNDMCDSGTYPDRNKPGGYAKYGEWMADFIRDVRKDLGAPKMPFVIGVIGVDGDKATGGCANLRPAMAAPAAMPEFKGNVAAVQTAPYWDKPLAEIADKLGKLKAVAYLLGKEPIEWQNISSRHPIAYSLRDKYLGKDGKMTKQQQQAFLKEYRAKLITPEEEAMWKRGASNAGYHYLGCGKTMALMGKAFAEAMVEMEKK